MGVVLHLILKIRLITFIYSFKVIPLDLYVWLAFDNGATLIRPYKYHKKLQVPLLLWIQCPIWNLSKVSDLKIWRYEQRFCSYFQFVFFQMLGSYYLSFIIWRTVVRWYGINKRTSWTPPSKRLTLESMYPIKFAWPFKFDCKWKKMRLFISNNFLLMVIRVSNHIIKVESDLPR